MTHRRIGEGTFGCVYDEAFPCEIPDRRPANKSVSKVYKSRSEYVSERNTLNALKFVEIDPREEYALYKYHDCKIKRDYGERFIKPICKDPDLPPGKSFNARNFTRGGESLEDILGTLPGQVTRRPDHDLDRYKKIIVQLLNVANGIFLFNRFDRFHLDIKPGNLVVHDDVFKFIDFGLSKKLPDMGLKSGCFYTPYAYWPIETILLFAPNPDTFGNIPDGKKQFLKQYTNLSSKEQAEFNYVPAILERNMPDWHEDDKQKFELFMKHIAIKNLPQGKKQFLRQYTKLSSPEKAEFDYVPAMLERNMPEWNEDDKQKFVLFTKHITIKNHAINYLAGKLPATPTTAEATDLLLHKLRSYMSQKKDVFSAAKFEKFINNIKKEPQIDEKIYANIDSWSFGITLFQLNLKLQNLAKDATLKLHRSSNPYERSMFTDIINLAADLEKFLVTNYFITETQRVEYSSMLKNYTDFIKSIMQKNPAPRDIQTIYANINTTWEKHQKQIHEREKIKIEAERKAKAKEAKRLKDLKDEVTLAPYRAAEKKRIQ